ncbi:MAG: glycosyltransferase 87 family protein, partial [Nitrososphaerales archaeon]
PLGQLPTALAAQFVWAIVNVFSLVALLVVSIRSVRPDTEVRSRWLRASVLALPVFFLDPVFTSVHNGQIDLMLTSLVLWDLSRDQRAGRSIPTGIGLGIASAVKLTPLIFVPYLLLTKRFRVAWTAIATFVLCESAAFAASPRAASMYWTNDVFHYVRIGGYLGLQGLFATTDQSLLAALSRINHGAVPSGLLWAATAFVAVAGLLLAARVQSRCSSFAGIVVCATTALLISPVTWTHHMVWVVPAIVWMAFGPDRPKWGGAMTATTAIVFWAAPIWWVPSQIDSSRAIVNGSVFFVRLAGPLYENGWQLLAGDAFFLWMVLFLVVIALSARRRSTLVST